jgi:hypothetical protein
MTPGQHDAAMIDHLRWGHCVRRSRLKFGSLDKRSATSRTPIRHSFFVKHGPALAANPLHSQILPDCSGTAPSGSPTASLLAGQINLDLAAQNRRAICILHLGAFIGGDRNRPVRNAL